MSEMSEMSEMSAAAVPVLHALDFFDSKAPGMVVLATGAHACAVLLKPPSKCGALDEDMCAQAVLRLPFGDSDAGNAADAAGNAIMHMIDPMHEFTVKTVTCEQEEGVIIDAKSACKAYITDADNGVADPDKKIEKLESLKPRSAFALSQFGGVEISYVGQTLLVRKRTYLSLRKLILAARPLFMGIDRMSANKIVHLDIRTPNILIEWPSMERLLLIDFELARNVKCLKLSPPAAAAAATSLPCATDLPHTFALRRWCPPEMQLLFPFSPRPPIDDFQFITFYLRHNAYLVSTRSVTFAILSRLAGKLATVPLSSDGDAARLLQTWMQSLRNTSIINPDTDIGKFKQAWSKKNRASASGGDATSADAEWTDLVHQSLSASAINAFQTALAFLEATLTTLTMTSAAIEHSKQTILVVTHVIQACLPYLNPNPSERPLTLAPLIETLLEFAEKTNSHPVFDAPASTVLSK